jgi:Zinc finger, C2H2 type
MNGAHGLVSPVHTYENDPRHCDLSNASIDSSPSNQQPFYLPAPAFSAHAPPHAEMYPVSGSYDHFPAYPGHYPTAATDESSPEAPALEYCQSAASSELQSQRGSICSYPTSELEMDHHQHHHAAAAHRHKAEEAQGDWYAAPTNDHVYHRAMTVPASMPFASHPGMLPSQTEDLYRSPPQSAEWPATTGVKPFLPDIQPVQATRLPHFEMQPVLGGVNRVKKKRQRTTPEEATHECRVCGKLFKRSYNWKSHLDTHNPDRKYPHPCTAMVGTSPCSKKFQRKTDLDRHYDSVSPDLSVLAFYSPFLCFSFFFWRCL